MSGYKGNLNPAPRSSNPELSRDEEREADRAGNRANQGQRSSAQGEQQAGQRGPPGFQGQSQPAVGFARGRAFPTSQRGSGSALPSHFTMSSNFGGSYAAPPVSPFAGSSGSRPPAGSHNTITTGNPPTLAAPGRTFGYTLVPPIPMPNTLASAPLGYVTPTPAPLVPVSFVPVMLAPTPLAPASAVPAAIAVAAPAAVPVPAREVRLKTFNAPPGGTAAAGRGSTRVYSTTPEGPLRAPGHSCSDP